MLFTITTFCKNMTTPSHVVARLGGGRAGNPIIEAIRNHASPTDGDQLSQFVTRNRSLITEFVLVLCGFLVVVMIVLFFTLLVVIMTNAQAVQTERVQFEKALLKNYGVAPKPDA
ncbi:nesp051 [Neophasia sp. alphabaculovirus]|nr:nesp051 [Neophasia sp. alphabaculovirus]